MFDARKLLLVLLAFGLPTASASAAKEVQFKPNHMFAVHFNSVSEYDSAGSLVRTIELAGPISNGFTLAFAPDGTLLVGETGKVIRLSGSGEVVDELDITGSGSLSSITMGPGGHFFTTNTNASIREFDRDGLLINTITGRPFAVDMAFGPGGHLLMATLNGELAEIDPSGAEIRVIDRGVSLQGVCVPPGGGVVVAQKSVSDLAFLDEDGVELLGTQTSGQCSRAVVGPDWSVYTLSGDNDKALGYLGSLVTDEVSVGTLFHDFVFAPFRFKVTIKGRIAGLGDVKKFKESAVLSIAPGSGRLMLQFEDDPEKANDYATVFGADAFVGHGLEGNASDTKTERIYTAHEVRGPALSSGMGNLSLIVSGKMDANGFFRVKSAKGSFMRTAGLVGLQATVTTKGGPLK